MGRRVRFDDSLKTVLAADASTAFGAQATFRQLADLLARGRAEPNAETLGRLRALRSQVPASARAAAARGLALGRPSAALIALFAEDEPAIAQAALRGAMLQAEEWIAILPRLGPVGRAALRQRTDLDPVVVRALESFGPTDFALGYDAPAAADQPEEIEPAAALDAVAEMIVEETVEATEPSKVEAIPSPARAPAGFEIAALVDRIESFKRDGGMPIAPRAPAPPASVLDHFRFETGADGVIRWSDAVPRGAVVGLSLFSRHEESGFQALFERRAAIADAPVVLDGAGAVAGAWCVSAMPLFEQATGQFVGYRGEARRPATEKRAGAATGHRKSEGLRRLVHELRTPTNAIAGFSELIEAQLLGPVDPVHRERASTIRSLAADLVAAIEDLDLAARMESDALELRPGVVPLAPLLERVAGEMQSLAARRGSSIGVETGDVALGLACDDRAAERLFTRLIGTMVSASREGEAIRVAAEQQAGQRVQISITRPQTLADMSETALLNLDAERETALAGAPLLGTGFALRLIANLALELGGRLTIEADRLTVTLPAASIGDMGQASTN